MIPILYQGTETSFTNNGIGRLADAISCRVTEELNGSYELEIKYPITGIHYSAISEGKIILAKAFDGGAAQPFIVYKLTKPINGIVTVNAEHISYRLTGIPVMPFTATSIAEAMVKISSYSAITNPFTFSTDISSAVNYALKEPRSCRNVLGGEKGSVLDVFGQGEFEFDRFSVILRAHRGSDNHVTLRYGKNITDLQSIIDMTSVYTGICPYWTDGTDTVTLTEKVILSDHTADFPFTIIKAVDFSSDFETAPSEAQLRTKAQSYVTSNKGWRLSNKITVSFVNLHDTEEYKNVAVLERVKMGDTVNVLYERLGVNFTTKVVKTEYDVLLERYSRITLGENSYSFGKVIQEQITEAEEAQSTHMERALKRATELLRGGLGGYVVLKPNANGFPEEILIMDTPDINTAVNVIRMNMNGIGFSRSGYDPELFKSAWTIDGHFIADFIDTGTLTANIIKAGILSDGVEVTPGQPKVSYNFWNLETGEFLLSPNKTKVGTSQNNKTLSTTISDTANSAVSDYDTQTLNQQKVFDKLFKTAQGYNTGVALTNGNLYLSATYIKSGALEVGGNNNMVGSITLKAANGNILGVWGNAGFAMYNGAHDTAQSGDRTGYWDSTGLHVLKGAISGASLTVGGSGNTDGYILVNDASGNEIGRWNNSGLDVKSGTITGAKVQTASSGPRMEMNKTSTLEGKNDNGTYNRINMMQGSTTQMTIDADTQFNIRTPLLGVIDHSYGTESATVKLTLTDSENDYTDERMDEGRNCWRIHDVRKYMPADPQTGEGQPYEMHEIYLHDEGQYGDWQVFCTLPVFLKFRYKNERRMHGMVLSTRTADSIVV